MYFDDGGFDCDDIGGEYFNNVSFVVVLCLDVFGSFIIFCFFEVDVEIWFLIIDLCWDYICIYDGVGIGFGVFLINFGCGEEGFVNCSGFLGDGGDGGGVESGLDDINGFNFSSLWSVVYIFIFFDGCLSVEFDFDGSVQEGGWVVEVVVSLVGVMFICDDGI